VPIPEISVQEAQARLSAPNPPRLIDVREAEEWELCRLPGAEFLPLSAFADLGPSRLTDPDEALIIYCHHGSRSARVTEFLIRQGFTRAENLAGGIDAWSAEIDPSIPRY
jgi:adenylyltransferase/sulfurtransferase